MWYSWVEIGSSLARTPCNPSTAAEQQQQRGSKTNAAYKHILQPKPAGFGPLLPVKNEETSTLLVLRCEVNWLTQPCHCKVNTATHWGWGTFWKKKKRRIWHFFFFFKCYFFFCWVRFLPKCPSRCFSYLFYYEGVWFIFSGTDFQYF